MSDGPGGVPGMPPAVAPESEPKRGSRAWVWIVIGVVILLLVGAAYAASQGSEGGGWLFLFGGKSTVPQVVGLAQKDAEAALSAAELRLGKVSDSPTLAAAPGTVVSQSPAATTVVAKDSAVDIAVASIPQAKVPDVTGQSLSAASSALAAEGLPVGETTYAYDSAVKAGYVKSQEPVAGTAVTVGTPVALTVSKGEQTGQVPNVVGLSEDDAKATLAGAGFETKSTKATNADVPAGDVISQSPAAGTIIAAGSMVTITVSTGAPAESTPPPPPSNQTTPPAQQPPAEPSTPEAAKVKVPDLVGMRVLEALRALLDAKLKFTIGFGTSTENFLRVAAQNPKAGTEVDPGTSVKITIGLPSFSFGGGGGANVPSVQPLPSSPPTAPGSSPTTP